MVLFVCLRYRGHARCLRMLSAQKDRRRLTMNTQQETMKHTYITHATPADAVTVSGLILSVLGGGTAMLAGLGSRWGWWHFTVGFTILQVGAITGIAAAVVSLVGGIAIRREHHPSLIIVAAVGIVIGLVSAGIPWSWMRTAELMPKINDITTDRTNPPQFVKIMPLRQGVSAPTSYGGARVANQQRASYPDIRPVILPVAPSTAFSAALKDAKNRGWQVVNADAAKGIIEAVATTFWFGFKDDVVVRISPAPGGSRVDMRSVSRVGRGDIGTNASRIRSYLENLAKTSIVDNNYTSFASGY
jgi:uncharacterized protein (DUF1499 family)